MKNVALLVTLVLVLGAAGCGDTTDDEGDAGETATTAYSDEKVLSYGKPASEAPRARIPPGPPPRELTIDDFRIGSGPAVDEGDEAIVNYVGYRHLTRKRFDSSYRLNPRPYRVFPGQGDYIDGFEEGIVGMRVGGLRQVTMPPDKAYGEGGYSRTIGPNETLIFVIELEALTKRD